ncbi:hypothetical protein VDG1235_3412 [Verrucomicrobiia bacterium DG1235]|nr:hypothetical protein VDG1235_3412 [Verrucomicrobiae bacterium DG1235]
MIRKSDWTKWASASLLVLTLALLVKTDISHLDWVAKLNQQGSPTPQLDSNSPTGYEFGQRHFLGSHNRGETYRWIAYTQELMTNGFFGSKHYSQDTAPTGRPQLLPKLFAAWLAFISWIIHLLSGAPLGLCVEKAALWEPVISHAIAFTFICLFTLRRFGIAHAALAGLFLALFPPFSAQFIPGALTPLPWALLFSAYALALHLPTRQTDTPAFPAIRSAAVLSIAIWLDVSIGFPALLISTACGVASVFLKPSNRPFLAWASVGSALCLAAWALDQTPLSPEPSELRYLHPLYPLCWLGIGLLLDSLQGHRTGTRPKRTKLEGIVGLACIATFAYLQISRGYPGWLFSSAAELRISSLDETIIFQNAFLWVARASAAERVLLLAPVIVGLLALVLRIKKRDTSSINSLILTAVPFIAALTLSYFKIRWGIVVSLLAIPLVCWFASQLPKQPLRQILIPALGVVFFTFFALGKSLPNTLKRPNETSNPSSADLGALMYRHFSHWLAIHNPNRDLVALAPPELSDSIIFHGAKQSLLSTAWESHPGQVAASRVLSSPENTEAEAIIQSRGITTIVLPSWDPVLPMLVQQPDKEGEDTLFDRMDKWLLPLYIEPLAYQTPAATAFSEQKFAAFEVTPLQDEALALSRLAEYFVEQRRSEPAQLVAKSLLDAFPDDPNTNIACAFVYADANNQLAFQSHIKELARDTEAGLIPMDWDRRAIRSIALALGKRHQLAKTEVQACLESISQEALYQLSSLQTFQFLRLVTMYKINIQDDSLKQLALQRCSEYLPRN